MFTDPLHNWILYAGVGAVLLLTSLAIVHLSEPVKLFIGRYMRPCWLTALGAFLGVFGYFVCYRTELYLLTIALMLLSGILDLVDGPVGRAWDNAFGKRDIEGRWAQFNHPGTTLLGKSLDPLADKFVTCSVFLHMAYMISEAICCGTHDRVAYLYMAVAQLLFIVIADVVGQLARTDLDDENKAASLIGKVKSPVQRIWMLMFPIWHKGWVAEQEAYLLALNFGLAIVLGLTIMSAGKKLLLIWRSRQVGNLVQE